MADKERPASRRSVGCHGIQFGSSMKGTTSGSDEQLCTCLCSPLPSSCRSAGGVQQTKKWKPIYRFPCARGFGLVPSSPIPFLNARAPEHVQGTKEDFARSPQSGQAEKSSRTIPWPPSCRMGGDSWDLHKSTEHTISTGPRVGRLRDDEGR